MVLSLGYGLAQFENVLAGFVARRIASREDDQKYGGNFDHLRKMPAFSRTRPVGVQLIELADQCVISLLVFRVRLLICWHTWHT